jgi:NADH:ubiquinone oxidoreductase subunit H
MLLLWSLIISLLFFPFYFNLFFIFNIFSFIWIRASLPRLRYDQLINLGWSYILPITITYFIIIISIIFIFW